MENRTRILDQYLMVRAVRFQVLVLVACAGCLVDSAAWANDKTFAHVVQQHFPEWTDNGKTPLSRELVNQLIVNPRIRGAEAAALASIHCYQRKAGQQALPVTRELLTASRHEDGTLRRDQAAFGANLSMNYRSYLKHIQTRPRKVFEVNDLKLEDLAQGHLGDCFFVAGVGVAVHTNPNRIKTLLHPLLDGGCDVYFPEGRKVHVPPLTDAQIALGSSAGTEGTWLNVLEVAAGTIEEQSRKDQHGPALDAISSGGDSVFTIELLTGHKALKDSIRAHVKGTRPAPTEQDVPRLVSQIEHHVRDGLLHQRMICCGIGEWEVPPGMGKWHQYAILGMEHGMIQLWNPWGRDYHFTPKGPAGLQHGYATEHGRFSMPIHDFVRVFGAVNVETAERVR